MSQHDMVIDNGPGLAVRTDINAAIQALVSQSLGVTEPTTKYAGQLWLDTSVAPQGRLRQRNLANTAWIDLDPFGFTPVQQGGGASQLNTKVYVGAAAGNTLRAQVDTTDLGQVWTSSSSPVSNVTNGYQKLTSGLMIQWGSANNASGDWGVTFPTAFPSACHMVVASVIVPAAPAGTQFNGVQPTGVSVSGFAARTRQINSGTVSAPGGMWISYLAIGA